MLGAVNTDDLLRDQAQVHAIAAGRRALDCDGDLWIRLTDGWTCTNPAVRALNPTGYLPLWLIPES